MVNFTERSRKTFKIAAEKRKDGIYEKTFLGKENSTLHDGYHRLCYQLYTSSSKLMRFSETTVDSEEHVQLKKPKTRLSVLGFSPQCCLFCQGTKFIRKGASKRRVVAPLQKCLTNNAAKKILEASYARKDETILRRIEGEDLLQWILYTIRLVMHHLLAKITLNVLWPQNAI